MGVWGCGGVLGAAALYRKTTYTTGNFFLCSSGLLPWTKRLFAAEVHLLAQFPPEGIQ